MTNRLANEVSPYLRQHENNPVHWFAWGDDAFAEARKRNVPILLSVGYSACHWCHVMAHECFEDNDVATQMNTLFVNIKVDREERPDVDAVYMEAVQAMTGRGGWPMTVFMTPDAKPFFGGTYFPKPSFLQLMTAVTDVWENRREDIDTNVDALMQSLQRSEFAEPSNAVASLSTVTSAVTHLVGGFDSEWGGFGAAPKFPSTMNIDLLLRSNATHPNAAALHVSTTSLDAMASGGIYDHLGGGFARYSVDREWLVPHFEKMLYDQALLVRVYLHAYQVTQFPRYKQVVEEKAKEIRDAWTALNLPLRGGSNEEAATCDIVVVATPWDSAATTVREHSVALRGKVLISMANALVRVGHDFQPLVPPRGSVAAHVQVAVPDSYVVAAFHHLPAKELGHLGDPIDSDVLICSDHKAAIETVSEMVRRIPGCRPLDSGELSNATAIEAFTAVLLQLNIRYKTRAALKLNGIKGDPRA